jgi:Domain of unknown function (DUF5673)
MAWAKTVWSIVIPGPHWGRLSQYGHPNPHDAPFNQNKSEFMVLAVAVFLGLLGVQFTLAFIFVLSIIEGIRCIRLVRSQGRAMAKQSMFNSLVNLGIMLTIVGIWVLLERLGVARIILLYGNIAVYPWLSWWWCERQAGNLHFNLGRLPTSKSMLLLGALEGAVAILFTIVVFSKLPEIWGNPNPASKDLSNFGLLALLWSSTSLFVRRGLSRLELRDKGILKYGNLIRWDQIKSYQWKQAKQTQLVIHHTLPIGIGSHRSWLTIPTHHQADVEQLLTQEIPNVKAQPN